MRLMICIASFCVNGHASDCLIFPCDDCVVILLSSSSTAVLICWMTPSGARSGRMASGMLSSLIASGESSSWSAVRVSHRCVTSSRSCVRSLPPVLTWARYPIIW
ncbi:hypothetical protein BJY01DRAFT_214927 [Aspergillus pseudoustus]|uniref:Secreted protein n=1 Tax=Aspergillus pseudoustus TaxID=1810923 RepID=A0ABR4JWR8_9EURO